MTRSIYLDADERVELEPFEERPQFWYTISPFNVPKYLRASGTGGVQRVEFGFPGGISAERRFEPLDDRTDPPVEVEISEGLQQLVSLTFADPGGLSVEGLNAVADRLEAAALRRPKMAVRFSYQMTARVLKEFAPKLFMPDTED